MASKLTDDVLRQTLAAVAAHEGSRSGAARQLGVTEQTIIYRIDVAVQRGLCVVQGVGGPAPPLPRDPARTKHSNPPQRVAELFDTHLAWAERAGETIARRLPRTVYRDDVLQAARLGLWAAAKSFDESLGCPFKNYAAAIVRGHIRDALRESDPLPRSLRKLLAARLAAEAALGHNATPAAVQAHLGWSDEQYRLSLTTPPHSLDFPLSHTGDGRRVELIHVLAADAAPPPIEQVARAQALLRGLEPDEFCVVYLFHWKRATMQAIGGVLQLSTSRVSQIHAEVCRRVRREGKEAFLDRA